MAGRKEPDPDRKPIRTLVELIEKRKRLERRGRELMDRARALAVKIEAAPGSSDQSRGKQKE